MFWIESKVIPHARWEIKREALLINSNRALKHDQKIIEAENDFIANYNPIVYCNDLTGEEWCFDTKLPTGGWLENIKPTWDNDGVRVFRAIVIC
jgi:hypothetical protein